ncbi:extracellular catalytic domain type 2 short-chain-length polyhydroxyalkanoate depolymerase [Pseudoduganella chitinolytica]|uniref:PHB depolymerase family esterase n=1 Tax=Pseudoduganella chitinolytica TaxID=34070 RepID=A0ABY8B7P1_9BURK|nr:PHB depolymerase family esterase [Pseudoduganella chitinolytica]WEF31910.1 PHB depolymerase family esterase [Pseudoduganella chitinolytica]
MLRSSSRKLIIRTVVALAMLAATLLLPPALRPTHAQAASLPALKAEQLSVSGLSSGGFMAVQFDVAYSASIVGAGIIAGGPYNCARGSVNVATMVCSCTSGLPWCSVSDGGTGVASLVETTATYAQRGHVDPTANLARQRIWLFSGRADTVVPTAVMDDLAAYYRHFLPPDRIRYRSDIRAEHAIPTDRFGNGCGELGAPYISNCGVDGAGELLNWIYGSLNPRSTAPPAGRFIEFNQEEFIDSPRRHGMATTGIVYVPPGCEGNAAGCRLHVAFHGCKQTAALVGEAHTHNAGYNAWADTNRIVVLYPQAAPVYPWANPNACWDWFSYDDANYALKTGRQMRAVKRMTERLMGLQ